MRTQISAGSTVGVIKPDAWNRCIRIESVYMPMMKLDLQDRINVPSGRLHTCFHVTNTMHQV